MLLQLEIGSFVLKACEDSLLMGRRETKCHIIKRYIIGINHDFLCIKIYWALREVLQPGPERRGFQRFPRAPANVNACLITIIAQKRKLGRNCICKCVLSVAKKPRKRHIHCMHFENAASRANTK